MYNFKIITYLINNKIDLRSFVYFKDGGFRLYSHSNTYDFQQSTGRFVELEPFSLDASYYTIE